MKKRILLLCLFTLAVLGTAFPQEQAEGCIAQSIPFTLEKRPDSLHIGNGRVTLRLQVLEDGTIAKFEILGLTLTSGHHTLINFVVNRANAVRQEDYPENVQQYYPAIKNFVDHIILRPTEYATYYYNKNGKRPFLITMPIHIKKDKMIN